MTRQPSLQNIFNNNGVRPAASFDFQPMKTHIHITACLSLLLAAPSLLAQQSAVSTITKGAEVKLSPAAFGYNTQSLSGPGWDKQPFLDRIAELDPSNFRYPGGTVGNFWDWKTGFVNDTGRKYKVMGFRDDNPYPFKLEDVKKVYDRSGGAAEPVYMLNMLTSTYEDQLAMLKHAQEIGLPVRYIEMGNEFYMDDHPKTYNYLHKYPDIKDYADDCRVWINKLRKEFPGARFAMIAINNPAGWTGANRGRSRDWNKTLMENLTGFDVDAFTFHNYAKNNFADQTPEDLLAQSIHSAEVKDIKRGIPAKYPYWVTEYNFFTKDNKLPGLWATGLANAVTTAQMLSTPGIEMLCFFNLTASGVSTAIYDKDTKIAGGATAKKYALSASGQALKIFSQAQKSATAVRRLAFSDNPVNKARNRDYNTLYGYLFTGAGTGDKALVVNLGAKPMTIDLSGLGFAATTAGQTWAQSLRAPIVDDDSVSKETAPLAGKKQLTLKPYSVTLIK